jgi:hypothetical protein
VSYEPPTYIVATRGGRHQVWLAPWKRLVSLKDMDHDDAVVLCERLNLMATAAEGNDPS